MGSCSPTPTTHFLGAEVLHEGRTMKVLLTATLLLAIMAPRSAEADSCSVGAQEYLTPKHQYQSYVVNPEGQPVRQGPKLLPTTKYLVDPSLVDQQNKLIAIRVGADVAFVKVIDYYNKFRRVQVAPTIKQGTVWREVAYGRSQPGSESNASTPIALFLKTGDAVRILQQEGEMARVCTSNQRGPAWVFADLLGSSAPLAYAVRTWKFNSTLGQQIPAPKRKSLDEVIPAPSMLAKSYFLNQWADSPKEVALRTKCSQPDQRPTSTTALRCSQLAKKIRFGEDTRSTFQAVKYLFNGERFYGVVIWEGPTSTPRDQLLWYLANRLGSNAEPTTWKDGYPNAPQQEKIAWNLGSIKIVVQPNYQGLNTPVFHVIAIFYEPETPREILQRFWTANDPLGIL
jgi:hypothetical protein